MLRHVHLYPVYTLFVCLFIGHASEDKNLIFYRFVVFIEFFHIISLFFSVMAIEHRLNNDITLSEPQFNDLFVLRYL